LGSLTNNRITKAAYRFTRCRKSSGSRPCISNFYFLVSALSPCISNFCFLLSRFCFS
jgi:hypothetical protein